MCLFCSTSSRMENKAMYLHTFNERENGSIFEEPFEGRNLSKLNLCEDGEYGLRVRLGLGGGGLNLVSQTRRASGGGTWELGLLRKNLSNSAPRRQRCLTRVRCSAPGGGPRGPEQRSNPCPGKGGCAG